MNFILGHTKESVSSLKSRCQKQHNRIVSLLQHYRGFRQSIQMNFGTVPEVNTASFYTLSEKSFCYSTYIIEAADKFSLHKLKVNHRKLIKFN